VSRATFYPYPTVDDGIGLNLEAAAEAPLEPQGRTIPAQELGDNETLILDLQAEVEPSAYDWVLPEDERSEPPTELRVAVRSVQSRRRFSVRLDPMGDQTRFGGQVELPKREYHGEVTLEPSLVRVSPGDDPGYAQHLGAQLVFGDSAVVQVDEPPVPPGEYLEIDFEDFLTSPNRQRRQHADLLYSLDTARETPKLWLNSRVEDFQQVMRHDSPRGRLRRIRDATFDTIVSQVWTSLASIAFSALAMRMASQGEEDSEEDPIEGLPDWEQRVIYFWAPRLYPGGREDALEEVRSAARVPEHFAELHERLGTAIQDWVKSPEAFKGLMRWYHGEGV
jgi:hypothetical protein